MYPVRIKMEGALERIAELEQHGHSAEALITSVFTLEKLMRRSMRLAIIARGFTSKHADHLLGDSGFERLKQMWDVFDPKHRKLTQLITPKEWQHVPESVTMRNKFVHGVHVYSLTSCREHSAHVLNVIRELHRQVCRDFGRDPWSKMSGRKKPKLAWHLREAR